MQKGVKSIQFKKIHKDPRMLPNLVRLITQGLESTACIAVAGFYSNSVKLYNLKVCTNRINSGPKTKSLNSLPHQNGDLSSLLGGIKLSSLWKRRYTHKCVACRAKNERNRPKSTLIRDLRP